MPWVKLKRWIEVHAKRKRREWKMEAVFHQMSGLSTMAKMWGGAGVTTAPPEMSDEERVKALSSFGFKVQTQKKE